MEGSRVKRVWGEGGQGSDLCCRTALLFSLLEEVIIKHFPYFLLL